eukprot:Protomagalhaensia_sp_Gyna_25__1638@NODE_1849_length_1476_cov_7_725818_g1518_i0_p1_GENE_NODE_1849_length_1476_cov_7_725818_g1518_i0NODE_1849_length_1476_cov_7_725818_g1518_i0_p1_ORF_typecomplete_len275_score33_73Santigen/PF05756_11/0_22DNA_pol_phi/PF04931_13/2_9_NODE_1849_length_1476_cov_7_725818_g1518_i077901
MIIARSPILSEQHKRNWVKKTTSDWFPDGALAPNEPAFIGFVCSRLLESEPCQQDYPAAMLKFTCGDFGANLIGCEESVNALSHEFGLCRALIPELMEKERERFRKHWKMHKFTHPPHRRPDPHHPLHQLQYPSDSNHSDQEVASERRTPTFKSQAVSVGSSAAHHMLGSHAHKDTEDHHEGAAVTVALERHGEEDHEHIDNHEQEAAVHSDPNLRHTLKRRRKRRSNRHADDDHDDDDDDDDGDDDHHHDDHERDSDHFHRLGVHNFGSHIGD